MNNHGPIIVLEDDEEDRDLLREVFAELGVREKIIFFTDGETALNFLLTTDEQPFLILSDINLPVMNGLQFQEKVSQNEYLRKKSIPLVFLTTFGSPEVIEKVYSLTVQGFFIKPSSFAAYKNTLDSIASYWRLCKHPNTEAKL